MEKTLPWYVPKRAEAFVLSLLAERALSVSRQESKAGVDFLVDLQKNNRETGQRLAIAVLPFAEFPSELELEQEIASRFPSGMKEYSWPLVVFAVQVKKLAAVYSWLLKPCFEKGNPVLCRAIEYDWKKLDDKAMNGILAQVADYWKSVRTIVLKDRMLPMEQLEQFTSLLEEQGAKLAAKIERSDGELATVKNCKVLFDPKTQIAQWGSRSSFDVDAHMGKIRQLCKVFGFLD